MTHDHDVSARRVVALATAVGNFTEWFDFAVYGFLAAALGRLFLATYVITFLTATVHLGRSEALLLVAAGLVGYAVLTPFAGALSDRFGRRRINLVGGFGLAVVAVPAFALMGTGTAAGVLGGMLLFAVFQSMVSVTTVCMLVELFPAPTRSTSSAIGFNLGLALIGGPGPLVAAAIAGGTGSSTLPALYMVVVAAVCTLALARWLPEVGGRGIDADPAALRTATS